MEQLRKRDGMAFLGAAFLYGILYFAIEERILSPFWALNIKQILVFIILAVSLNLINGFTGQFSIGHAGFMAVGAYVAAVATTNFDIPFLGAIVLGAIAAGLLGFLVGLPTLRLQGDYLAIATLGLGEIIRIVILNIDYVNGAAGFSGVPTETTFSWAFWAMVISVFIIKNFIRSNYGRACIGIRENEIAAEAMGVNTTYYKVLAFTMGAFFAGVAGALAAHQYGIVTPSSFTFNQSFQFLTMVVLGGLGSITGSIVGAIALTLFSALLSDYPQARMLIYSAGLVALMNFRPQGIMGSKEFSMYMIRRMLGKGGEKNAA